MLLEWSRYPSEQRPERTSFQRQAIGEQHFPAARSIALFYSQWLRSILRFEPVSHKARCITTPMLYYYTTAVAVLYISLFIVPYSIVHLVIYCDLLYSTSRYLL